MKKLVLIVLIVLLALCGSTRTSELDNYTDRSGRVCSANGKASFATTISRASSTTTYLFVSEPQSWKPTPEVANYHPIDIHTCTRQFIFDLNWIGGRIEDYLIDADPEEYVEYAKEMNIDAIYILLKDHHGYSPHPTKVGKIYPNVSEDFTFRLIDACHREGIAVIGYLSVLDWDWGRHHNDLLQNHWGGFRTPIETLFLIGEFFQGLIYRHGGYQTPCLNSSYLDYLLAQEAEVLSTLKIDALRFDMLYQRGTHNCAGCMQFYKEIFGKTKPDRWNDWRDQATFQRAKIDHAWRRIYSLAKEVNPRVPICAAAFMQGPYEINNQNTGRLQDFQRIEFADPDSFSPCFQSDVCGNIPGIAGQIFNLSECARWDLLAHGMLLYHYSKVDRQTGLPPPGWRMEEKVKKFYGEVKEVEEYLVHTEPLPYLAIVYCEANRFRYRYFSREHYLSQLRAVFRELHHKSLLPRFINSQDIKLENIKKYAGIMLVDTTGLTKAQVDTLRQYVESGGNLIATGHSAIAASEEVNKPLSDLLGLKGTSAEDVRIKVKPPKQPEWLASLLQKQLSFRGIVKTKYIAGETLVTTQIGEKHFPFIHVRPLGKGRVIYIACPDTPSKILVNLAMHMAGSPPVKSAGEAEIILKIQPDNKRLIIHRLGPPDTALIRKDVFPIKSARLVFPEEKELDAVLEGNYFRIEIPGPSEVKDRAIAVAE